MDQDRGEGGARIAGSGARAVAGSVRSQALALVRDVIRTGGRRFWLVALLATAAAVLQGGGVVLLVPLLHHLELVTAPAGGAEGLRAPFAGLGLGGILAFYVVAVAGIAGIQYAHAVTSTGLVLDYGDSLRRRLHQAVMAMGWEGVMAQRGADLTHALTAEVGQCGYAVTLLLNLLSSGVQVPALLAVAVALSPRFTVGTVVLAGVIAVAMAPLNRRAHALATAQATANRELHAEVADELAGLRVLKVLRAEAVRAQALAERVARLRQSHLVQIRAYAAASRLQQLVAAIAAAVGVWVGVWILGLGLADMLVLVLAFGRIMMVATRMQEQARQILRVLPVHSVLSQRLAEFRAAAEPRPVAPPPELRREIRLEGLGYWHRNATAATLQDVDAVIPAFATTALVGSSGAGKSTLADLVMGLTTPSQGVIRVDDTVLDGPARVAWRARVGYVPQDPFLFHDTIRRNLLLARPDAAEPALWRALDAAAADFVRHLPQGLDTVVGDRGLRLSGGERQRIVLARALLQQPMILVLDEATSALDQDTETRVLQTLRQLHGRMTVLVIAHRASTIALADHLIRLEAGIVVPAAAPAPASRGMT
ncbi:MAG: ABC transporter ATP-binding protein [Azospirillaceae bacterium]|nr:ABC transporter ATP-binding protein [Azospirillaceae bacterium]